MKNIDIPSSKKINIQNIGDLQDVLTKELGVKDIESKAEHLEIFANFLL